MKYCHLQQHGWTLRYYAKQNKSVRKREEPYDFTHVEYKPETDRQATVRWLPEGRGWGSRGAKGPVYGDGR